MSGTYYWTIVPRRCRIGLTVPHVHFHIIPCRLQGDCFADSSPDLVYVELEKHEGVLLQDLTAAFELLAHSGRPEPLKVDADALREPRTWSKK
jgi:bis(5'-adenosyl)-triphosphatase